MDSFEECSVLIPTATLEDIGDCPSDEHARSLLAAWTALWHPVLLAQAEQLPSWYRADSPPAPDGSRLLAVPMGALDVLPNDYRRRCDANPQCRWLEGSSREDLLASLELSANEPPALESQGRHITVADFFAAGFLSLQVQVMTRRLRYTSNLDEIFLQTRIVAAAKAFLERDGEAASSVLHEVFDCLAEERDHYFSSDPHLIDLTLLTPEVLERALESGWLARWTDSLSGNDQGLHATPKNVLLDGPVAAAVAKDPARYDGLREALRHDEIGWAGGGPAETTEPLDAMTMSQAERVFLAGTELATSAFGQPPTVYGRLSGSTPADLAHGLINKNYCGVMPIDFTAGAGFGDEAKVLVSTGAGEIEALTAKPIDAASDRAFLTLGAELGESIDTGEVATGLMVHWPDQVCDSYRDLCRAATWGVAMGRFWTLQGYFQDGERPYHSASLPTLAKHAPSELAKRIDDQSESLPSLAKSFCDTIRAETDAVAAALARLANPSRDIPSDEPAINGQAAFLDALGLAPAEGRTKNSLCVNPHAAGTRSHVALVEGAPKAESFIYASSGDAEQCEVTFDTPAFGFTRLTANESVPQPGWLKRLTVGSKGIAEPGILRNEFMAVSLSDSSGGIEGVYSGSRGNRMSMRLVACRDGKHDEFEMVARSVEVVESSVSVGVIRSSGSVQTPSQETIADFELNYTLRRGRRILEIEGEIRPRVSVEQPAIWKNHLAIRTAVAEEASIFRPIVRDKVHSSSQRRMVSPLGILVDESEKQTLVAAQGLALHRRVGERFLDTLIAPLSASETNTQSSFRLSYVLDSKHPVASARACIAPPQSFALDQSADAATEQAWLVHCSPRELVLGELQLVRRDDGSLAARVQVIQPRPKTSKVTLRFCFDAKAAFLLNDEGINRSIESPPEEDRLLCEDGAVSFTLGGHQTANVAVILDA
ncbi:MAG: hypothetical protein AAFX06_01955 [Planctomycetota bacterium]